MDPIQAVVDILTSDSSEERRDLRYALRDWYARGGFRPTREQIAARVNHMGLDPLTPAEVRSLTGMGVV